MRDGIPKPENRLAFMSEIGRTIRTGGRVSLVEDLYIEEDDPEGQWYKQRYRIHAFVAEKLIEAGPIEAFYSDILRNPDFHLLFSLRDKHGNSIDEIKFEDKEIELVEAILKGDIIVRAVGVHESEHHVIRGFLDNGFSVNDRWHILIDETGEREGHSSVMKGMLLKKDGQIVNSSKVDLPKDDELRRAL